MLPLLARRASVSILCLPRSLALIAAVLLCFYASLAATTASAATGLTILHSFTTGSSPGGQLTLANGVLYGITQNGGFLPAGGPGVGTIYKMNVDGTGFTDLHVFARTDGQTPVAGPTLNGSTLYGTTFLGGTNQVGTVYRLGIDGSAFTNLYNFPNDSGPDNNPGGAMVITNNLLYGTTSGGQGNLLGGVFRLALDGTAYARVHAFTSITEAAWPLGDLLLDGTTLYGTTNYGGQGSSTSVYSTFGAVFRVNLDGTGYTILHSFVPSIDGAHPVGGLVKIGNTLYGAATDGGSSNANGATGNGVIYRVNIDGTGYALLHVFSGGLDGADPQAGLVAIGNVLFGTTAPQGAGNGSGTLFKLNADGTGYAVLHNFTGGPGGGSPIGGLARSGPVLYGTALLGGTNGLGTVFSYDLTPTTPNQAVATLINTPLPLTLAATVPNGFPVTYTTTTPLHGTLTGTAPNLTYTPNRDFIGTDTFTFKASDGLAESPSGIFIIPVRDNPPQITRQPASRTVNSGETVTFAVTANSLTPVTYQWSFKGAAIPGATDATLTLSTPVRAQAGVYSVTLSNGDSATIPGVTTSSDATLVINPAVTAGAFFGTISGGSAGGTFAVTAPSGVPATVLLQFGANRGLLAHPAFDSDGFFTVTARDLTTTSSLAPTLTGRIAGGQFTATITGGGTLAAPASPAASSFAGTYTFASLGTTTIAGYFIIADAKAYALIIDGATAAAGIGITQFEGTISISLPGGGVTGRIDPATKQFSGALTTSPTITVPVAGLADTVASDKRLANISTRGLVSPGDNALIAGFVVRGNSAKTLLVRAAGPALTAFGLTGTLARPQLQIFQGSSVLVTNTGWSSAGNAAAITTASNTAGAFAFVPNSADSAALLALSPGAYTAVVSGVNATGGIALVEVYDVVPDATRLINLSTRGFVGANDQTLIAGFVVGGNAPKTLLVRAVGPTLATLGLTTAVSDLAVEIVSAGTVLAANDNWSSTPVLTAATTAAGTFALTAGSKDSALIVTLAPGAYTVTVRSVNGASGIALAEVYELP